VGEPCGIATIDVSFISVLKILPALRSVLSAEASVVALVKPQFEVGRRQVSRGGLVKDPALHLQAVREVARVAQAELSYAVRGACASPVTGATGNREFFVHLGCGGPGLTEEQLQRLTLEAVES
jgi:23S rRNA (cytidine1920-2'-O)/16S rRNA (cytidine1409-2'-O)-methyltransferase